MDSKDFESAINNIKIPLLSLDQKWHRLFALSGKPEEVETLEYNIDTALANQGRLNQEIKELKRIKNDLMQGIVASMDESGDEYERKMEENKRLIEEVNEKLASDEDELLELPRLIDGYNRKLMLATMNYCYDRMRVNYKDAKEISGWIKQVRVELKKNIIKKQNREINNREIYAYMHDIFGKDVIELFDVQNSDVDITVDEAILGDTRDSSLLNDDSPG